jgi:hypothetical protein
VVLVEEPIGPKLAARHDVVGRKDLLNEVFRVFHHPDPELSDSSEVILDVLELAKAYVGVVVVLNATSLQQLLEMAPIEWRLLHLTLALGFRYTNEIRL